MPGGSALLVFRLVQLVGAIDPLYRGWEGRRALLAFLDDPVPESRLAVAILARPADRGRVDSVLWHLARDEPRTAFPADRVIVDLATGRQGSDAHTGRSPDPAARRLYDAIIADALKRAGEVAA